MKIPNTHLAAGLAPRGRRHPHRAFTLIELLVVVAIIALLIAILMPSLSRARYVAKLTVCESNLHQITVGAITYAFSSNSTYPYRPTNALTPGSKPNALMIGSIDDRPYLRKYIDLNKLINDPLGQPVDWINTNPTSAMEAPYHFFFGYTYKTPGDKGMFRVGDAWTWQNQNYHVIACDRDVVHFGGDYVHGSHPDRDGVMQPEALNTAATVNVGGNFTLFRWINYDTDLRGPIDMNFAYDDGSVRQLDNLAVGDDRLAPVPEFANGGVYPIAPTFVPLNH